MGEKRRELISIVIPAKDEEENVEILIKRIKKVLKKIRKHRFEVIVVCDNCKDSTEKIVKGLGVRTLVRKTNPGKSKALIDGFKAARGKILIMMDADLSHLPEDLGKLIKRFDSRKEIGLVIASRIIGGSADATFIRKIGGIFFNHLSNFFFGTRLTDAINGYKIFYRSIFDNFEYRAEGYAIEIELVANTIRAGYGVEEISSFEARRAGGEVKSKVIRDGWLFLREILEEGIKLKLNRILI